MSEILFRMAAKTDVGLVRDNNEDNFQASADLSQTPMRWVNNQQYQLGPKGALLVVADGMGGMNAGEVASEIAINTVREMFQPECLTDAVTRTRASIEKYMKNVVAQADKRIKTFANENPDSRGMGTTIVIAWMLEGKLYVTWCGDSRAYIYNPASGLFQVSRDHSYVQQLVDEGRISKEDAFDFPDSNIITRSLSDGTPKAEPECLSMPQDLCNGDIILLCSDGLNGMIRDEEIEKIIANNQNDMTELVDVLIQAAKDAAGADNVTVALAQVIAGGAASQPGRENVDGGRRGLSTVISGQSANDGLQRNPLVKWFWTIFVALVLTLGAVAAYKFLPKETEVKMVPETEDEETAKEPETEKVAPSTTETLEEMPGDMLEKPEADKKDGKKKSDESGKKGSDGKMGKTGTAKMKDAQTAPDQQGQTPDVKKPETMPADDELTPIRETSTQPEPAKTPSKTNEGAGENKGEEKSEAKGSADSGEGEVIKHTVKEGETLQQLAKTYGTTVEDIKRLNSIKDEKKVKAGWAIKIRKNK